MRPQIFSVPGSLPFLIQSFTLLSLPVRLTQAECKPSHCHHVDVPATCGEMLGISSLQPDILVTMIPASEHFKTRLFLLRQQAQTQDSDVLVQDSWASNFSRDMEMQTTLGLIWMWCPHPKHPLSYAKLAHVADHTACQAGPAPHTTIADPPHTCSSRAITTIMQREHC